MKTRLLRATRLCWLILALFPIAAEAQSGPFLDCNCLAKLPQLQTNGCQGVVPDLCALGTNCYYSTAVPPMPVSCNQTPLPGTIVGPGPHTITLTVMDSQGLSAVCQLIFNVAGTGCGFTLICSSNKTVECGTQWNFNPPTWTNACVPPLGTPSNGVVLTIVSTVSNGTCPQVITRTWQGVDDCQNTNQCSQTVTIVDTTLPQLSCACLTNNAVAPVTLTVIACTGTIPDLCLPASVCASDACGVVGCSQSPPAGTGVGIGVHPITVTVYDCASNAASCLVNFTVIAPAGGCAFSLICSSNKTVECGTQWNFNPPTWTNACVPPLGTPSNGVVLTIVSTVTNGTCPQVITRTWQGVDDCQNTNQCSQTVTIVDTTLPQLNCACLTNNPVAPVPLTVIACTSSIPDLCLAARLCASDNCGVVGCSQSPPAGTVVGVGAHPITVTVYDCASNTASCGLTFTVIAPAGGCGTNCVPPPSGMVAWWPLDEGCGATSYADLSANGNAAIVESGGPVCSPGSPNALVVGKVAGAGYFYQATSRGRAPNAPSLNFGAGSFSADCWVNPVLTGTIFWHPIVDKLLVTGPGAGFGYNVSLLNTKVVLRVGNGLLYTNTSVGSVTYGAWNFVGVSVDRASNTVTFHVNGVTESPQPLVPAGNYNSPVDLLIGGTYAVNSPYGELAIDELELFNRPLTNADFTLIWQADAAGKCKPHCTTYHKIWNTGMGGTNGNVPLSAGTPDPNYSLVSVPPGGCTGPAQVLLPASIPAPPWITNGPNSQWIGAGPTANCQGGVYHYRLCFNLTCADGASVVGQWSADDWGEMLLNGQPTGNTIPSIQYPYSFSGWHPIVLTNGFICGMNCLDFYVTNAYNFDNPTGFRAELTNTFNDCCCTATQTLFSVKTGVGPGGLLPQGAPDPQLALTCTPPGVSVTTPVVTQPSPFWMPNGPNSQWIGPFASLVNAPGGVYCYTLNFNIPCPTNVPIMASLNGQWMADDTGTIYLNGAPTGNTLPNGWAFTNWQAIAITSGFVPGLNTLTFYVTNGSASPTGIRLELTGTASCCACSSNHCQVFISCPTNLAVTTCNPAGGIVNYPTPSASSSCGNITNLVCTPASGSVFPLGTTTVTCVATDSQGNSAYCTFTITVTQAASPYTVVCPPLNLSVTGCPPVMPNLTRLVTIITNCPTNCSITVTQTVPAGTVLAPGPHTVIIRTCDCLGNCRDCDVVVNAVLSPGCCTPTPVLRLFSGATNSPAGLLPNGALDKQFLTGPPLFTSPNPYVPGSIPGVWVPNSTSSKWISPDPNYAFGVGGVFYYTNRFFLCSTNQAQLTGRWTADDTGTIYLNSAPTGNTLPGSWAFTNWSPVNITSGFVPGWNQLVFAVTNYGWQSYTGLRTEITGSSCCSPCVTIACPANIATNTCASGVAVSFPAPVASSGCGNIVSVTSIPPSGSVFPVGTTVVACTALDTAGNAATCSFTVTVVGIGQPIIIKCPPNQTLYTCGSNAVAYYKVFASGSVGPVVCTPPSGSTFPLGTNVVICSATNACGGVATCQFLVIVKPYPLGAPAVTMLAGLPDNFVLPFDPSPPSACLMAALPGSSWKGFDDPALHTLLGHRFAGLPNNIVGAELVVRMKPGDNVNANVDTLWMGLPACSFPSFLYGSSIQALPGAVPLTGPTWLSSMNGPTTFTMNLTTLDPALLANMNATSYFDVLVGANTTVDYMLLRLWTCPPPFVNNGVPHWTGMDANPASAINVIPQPELPAFGAVGSGPAMCISPPNGDPAMPNSVKVGLGGGQAFSFTTVLDMNALAGAQIVISAPTGDGTNAPLLSLVKGCKPRCGWDVIKAKRFDDGTSSSRVSAVSTNGNLLDSFVQLSDDGAVEPPLMLVPEDGVLQFPVSLMFEADTGNITLTFPGTVARRLCDGLPCPRGWDGTIKGRLAADGVGKGWDGTIKCPCYDDAASRIVFTPIGTYQPVPRGSLTISSTGISDLVLAGEQLVTMGGHSVQAELAGPEALATFLSTPAGDGVSWNPLADGSGVSVDLGRSAGFDVGIHHFENGDIPTEEQLFRIGGPKSLPGTTTNRPPPPVPPVDLRLVGDPNGVEASADFTSLGATGVTVNLLSNGVVIAGVTVPGPFIDPADYLLLDRWPERLAQLPGNGALSLTSSEAFNLVGGYIGNEVQFIPVLPPGLSPFAFYSELQCLGTAGQDNLLYDLHRVPACVPAVLTVTPTSAGTVLSWAADGYRLLGAETLDGPWIDLGVASPVLLPPNAPQRYFRLVCE